jgi:hypothetical protein
MPKVIKLTENQFGEMMAYHGSGSDFDKFNHKKYLSTGAGSQTFGWGTYVTTDEEIGKSYSDISINVQDLNKEDLIKQIARNFNYDLKSASDFVFMFYNKMNGFNIPFYYSFEKTVEGMMCYGFKKTDLPIIEFILKYSIDTIKKEKILYEVDIPDDNGNNYLSWYDKPTPMQQKTIIDGLSKLEKRFNHKILSIYCFVEGGRTYNTLRDAFNNYVGFKRDKSAKAASLFLMQCGFDGIKYPAGTIWKKPTKASEDAMNYVIFDASKVKIINKTRV